METQLFFGSKPEKQLIKPIKNSQWIKADGGIWTSTYYNGSSEWVEWCDREQFFTQSSREGWLLYPNSKARVYIIDCYKDLEILVNTYGIHPFNRYPNIDYEKMSKDYDGLHLTSKGRSDTRFSEPYSFSGWDVESTHWFSWIFDEVKYIGKIELSEIM